MSHDGLALTAPARRILVIEDEPGIRSFASRALSAAGFTVTLAAGGGEGLAVAGSEPFSFVLLDLGLPDLPGEEVLRRLRRDQPGLAVLVWSAAADRDTAHRCLLLGARAYLPKPVSIAELLQCLGALQRPAAAPGPRWLAAKAAAGRGAAAADQLAVSVAHGQGQLDPHRRGPGACRTGRRGGRS